MTEALDDDLNAPRAVAAMFTFMNEANAALDSGERAGPGVLSAWEKAEGVLGVSSRGIAISIPTGTGAPEGQPAETGASYPETSPAGSNEELQKAWALHWAVRRKQAKVARDYAEADRIRGLLRSAGWEVRDGKDGSVEVVRIPRAS
jgi:cysteinyl-tRNA synthetase